MTKLKKRGPKPKGITKVTRKYTLDRDIVARLEARHKDGDKSKFVNGAIDARLKQETKEQG